MASRSMILFIILCISICTSYSWSEDKSPDAKPAVVRADLEISSDLWKDVSSKVGYAGKPLGYTEEEMSGFPVSPYRLRTVDNLFRDTRSVPTFSGYVGDSVIKNGSDISYLVGMCFRLLDARSAREIVIPSGDKWGCDLIPDGVSASEAIKPMIICPGGEYSSLKLELDKWNELPEGVQRLVVRLLVASYTTKPYLDEAFDRDFLNDSRGSGSTVNSEHDALYKLASAPFREDTNIVPRKSFDALEKIDMNYLSYGSILFFSYLQSALTEFNEWKKTNDIQKNFPEFSFGTVVGSLLICGSGSQEIDGDWDMIIDLGGDDNHSGLVGVSRSLDYPVSWVVDLGGNDTYDSSDADASIGCGLFGIGAVIDLSGDDKYVTRESGIGCGWYGAGVVVDYAGRDKYTTNTAWGQGASHAGIGILADLSGDDEYFYGIESQGLGGPLGTALLYDSAGNDKYLQTDEVRKIAFDPSRKDEPPASLAQGCGYGRRADFGDGHSLSGGIGIMVEGGGDDIYEGFGRFVQGTGYWWGLGILEDYGGNDKYLGYWYAQGASAHFAIGCMVDLEGNDTYNDDYCKSQVLGNGRDGSLAVFIDGSGNDSYRICDRSGGEGDLNGIGLFWDRSGDDLYKVQKTPPFQSTPSFGAATQEGGIERTFRETMPTVGIFLDTAGNDTYNDEQYSLGGENAAKLKATNNSEWWHNEGPVLWGYGLDKSLF